MMKFNSIEEAIEDIRNGKIIVVVDDEDRENEGDLIMAADMVTGEAINFMATYGKGLICMPIEKEIADRLSIGAMVSNNTDNHETAFTVSIDYKDTTTGISAFERALTIQKVLESDNPNDFRRPGHMFPLVAKEDGVIARNGHTEAGVDLAKLAGFKGAGVICEIMKDDGQMARLSDLEVFCEKHNLKIITIKDLVEYRKKKEFASLVERVVEIKMPTRYGDFTLYGFENKLSGEEYIALVKGDVKNKDSVLLRVHSECLTGDALGSKRCDCGEQYDTAMKRIAEEECGVLIYMKQEGRGIGLMNKLKAYALQDDGLDTVEANLELGFVADARSYEFAAGIIKNLGIKKVNLMTNNPSKIEALEEYGIVIEKRIPIQMNHNEKNEFYLKTKKEKMGHMFV
ncbi:bifunctional 3,4-dihydroxy-2-butanone-4-phosphate synthase/GTP cyclohydrolase II [uncultured Clostridium sp.]|jgi:3,4-dihydroxy 2-butanone 4-phosphate synthase/GTP cyclohydrolase II|uniref:bifunctional 3,4-dihydroxy-2-butanone-4-phosphate synthase/GTP cyclohydrolase II n=1 Tax=uncultured Clostridium sp. TaxID=59620 RepID=UPI00262D86B0|nr:bifunctional 3,4-dihydroxy-2-butanone-4-phosphate synthase/GTP cyclohydrolase II [uncultured Clostridium sp.]